VDDDDDPVSNSPPEIREARADIRQRAFEFACRVVRLARVLERSGLTGRSFADQLFRSGTSVGANLEVARGAQSRSDFRSKCSIALKEARETLFWLRLLQQSRIIPPARLDSIIHEAEELVAILTSIVKKARVPQR
jgi:four helix bundle protein